MLIFGSTALKHWIPEAREPRDLDYLGNPICAPKGFDRDYRVEHHWNDAFCYVLENNVDETYVDLNFLYTIKVSHVPWALKNGSWVKHMHDIIFMKRHGAKLDMYLYNQLFKQWEVKHGSKKYIKFVDNDSVFEKDNVTRFYDHDDLHQIFAFGKEPMHNLIRPDEHSSYCQEELFTQLTHNEQIETALEEIYTIAAERYYIPHGMTAMECKSKAHFKLITSMTKGWFNRFLIENTEELMVKQPRDVLFREKLEGLKRV